MPTAEDKFLNSNFYEELTEHVFLSELLQEAWFSYDKIIEVSRSEIDASGYDLLLECNGFFRHVQLKSSDRFARASRQRINIALASKPSGCVIWLLRSQNESNKRLTLKYLFYGSKPGKRLKILKSFRVARHTKANSQGIKNERANIRLVPKSRFEPIDDTKKLLQKLFGLS